MRFRKSPAVPAGLVARIEDALAVVDAAHAELDAALAGGVSRSDRRAAHARLRHAYDAADALLREATRLAKEHSRREWCAWRARLSRLGTARQVHLFAERDDAGLLGNGSVRAVDTGMSGPDIGELQHGASKPPGTRATYGLDLEGVLGDLDAELAARRTRPVEARPAAAPPRSHPCPSGQPDERENRENDEEPGRPSPPPRPAALDDLRDVALAGAR